MRNSSSEIESEAAAVNPIAIEGLKSASKNDQVGLQRLGTRLEHQDISKPSPPDSSELESMAWV